MVDLQVTPRREIVHGRLEELLLEHLGRVDAHFWPGTDGLTTDVVLDGYIAAAAAGQVPGLCDLLDAHPELSCELEVMFSNAPCQRLSHLERR